MDQTDALIEQADAMLIAGQAEAARALCEKALAASEHGGARCILGNICLQQADPAEAYRHFLAATALDVESGDAFLGLGLPLSVSRTSIGRYAASDAL